jgi:hypothetical protein
MEKEKLLIFKTNIAEICSNCNLYKTLENHNAIAEWTIDLEDVDKVLRIVSESLTTNTVIDLVQQHGFECSELN